MEREVRMRTWIAAAIFTSFLAVFSSTLAAQNNPVPHINNPLVPSATPPGGPGFTLAVNGASLVHGAVVKWNGSARATTFVSPTQVTAAIPTSDLVVAETVFVTVSNPGPGGGISNAVFFEVTSPTKSLAYTRTDSDLPDGNLSTVEEPTALTVLDLTNTGNPYLAVANSRCPTELECIIEKASISFAADGNDLVYQTFTGASPYQIESGDFNGDGRLDLITAGPINYSILLNESNLLPAHTDYPLPAGCSVPFVLGDFNGDGRLDLVLTGTSGICILPGNGDGTFGPPVNIDLGTTTQVGAVGDFNGDGKLDLAVSNLLPNTVSILLGNGDGTFQPPVDYAAGPFPTIIVTADFNGDGKLDLAVVDNNSIISIYLGNGDGTFQTRTDYPAGTAIESLTMGDYDGDGILDLAVSDSLCTDAGCPATGSINVLLGNGDGTFQSHLDFADGGQPGSVVTGSFQFSGGQNGASGRPGFATSNNQQNTISVFDPITTVTVNPLPTISSISPSSALVNSEAFTLIVNGTNFGTGSTVYFGGQARVTTFSSATQLTAAIQAGDVAATGVVTVLVANPIPGGGDSTPVTFNVYGPPPTISFLSPSSVVAGGPAFTLAVNGANFVNGAVVNFNSTFRTPAFVSATQLTIAISASDIANQGTIEISVTDPVGNGSGGGTSSTLPLTILPANTQPVVGGFSPASTTAGGPSFTLILTGTGFTAGSVVTFNSNTVSSAYVSATQLQAAIPASAIAVAGTPFVTVANPGGIPSVVASFTVNNPVPEASSLSPSSVPAGNAAITLNVTGTNFNASSAILVNGSSRATTLVSSTSLSAALTASDFAHSGTLSVTVNNPTPGGGTTSALTVVVEDFKLNVQSPATSVPAGQPAMFSFMMVPANAVTANAVSLTATGVPPGATASFTPSSTIVAGSASATVTLTITTTAHSPVVASRNFPPRFRSRRPLPRLVGLTILLMGLGLLVLHARMRRIAPQFFLLFLLMIFAGLAACGSGGSTTQQLNPSTGTPAGTYSIVVTAASGNGSLSTTVMMSVM
jgi:hypothetical protein